MTLAAITLFDNDIRRYITSSTTVTVALLLAILTSLKHLREGVRLVSSLSLLLFTNEMEIKNRYAVCQCVHAFSCAVAVLRTGVDPRLRDTPNPRPPKTNSPLVAGLAFIGVSRSVSPKSQSTKEKETTTEKNNPKRAGRSESSVLSLRKKATTAQADEQQSPRKSTDEAPESPSPKPRAQRVRSKTKGLEEVLKNLG